MSSAKYVRQQTTEQPAALPAGEQAGTTEQPARGLRRRTQPGTMDDADVYRFDLQGVRSHALIRALCSSLTLAVRSS